MCLPSFVPDIDRVEPQTNPPDYHSTGGLTLPPPEFQPRSRRQSLRPGGVISPANRQIRPMPSICSNSASAGSHPVQLLSMPQLDVIQRTLKILDVRLQHVQTNAKNEEKTRQDIQHIRTVMSENQKALGSIVCVLGSLQDEVSSRRMRRGRKDGNILVIS